MNNPFLNKETNEITFPMKPIRDIVFILPVDSPKEVNGLIIPEQYRDNHRDEFGVVLAIGKGYYDDKSGKFIATTAQVGDTVLYDSGIPWEMDVKDAEGNKIKVKYCGEKDLQGIIEF